MDLGAFLPFLLGIGFLVFMVGMHGSGSGMHGGAHAGQGGMSRDHDTSAAGVPGTGTGDPGTGAGTHGPHDADPDASSAAGHRHGC